MDDNTGLLYPNDKPNNQSDLQKTFPKKSVKADMKKALNKAFKGSSNSRDRGTSGRG